MNFVDIELAALLAVAFALTWVFVWRGPSKVATLFFFAANLSGFIIPLTLFGLNIHLRPTHLLLIFAIVPLVVTLLLRRTKWRLNATDVCVLGYIAANFLSSELNRGTIGSTGLTTSVLLLSYAAMYFVVSRSILTSTRDSGSVLRQYTRIGVVLGASVGLVMFAGYAFGLRGAFWAVQQGGVSFISARGTFEESNVYGIACATYLALATGTMTVSRKSVLGSGLVFLVLILGVLLSYTRSAWAMSILVLGLYVSKLGRARRILKTLALSMSMGLALFLIFSAGAGFGDRLGNTLSQRFENIANLSQGTGEARVMTVEYAFDRFLQRPLLGNGTNAPMVNPYSGVTTGWTFSSLIQTLYNTGVVGIIFLIGVFTFPLLDLLRLPKSPKRLALLLAGLVVVVTSQSSSVLWLDFFWVFWGLLRGVTVKMQIEASPHAHSH